MRCFVARLPLLASATVVVVTAACPTYNNPNFAPVPKCTTQRHEALYQPPPSALVLSTQDGSLVCIAGQGDECDDAEADCDSDIGAVDLGADTIFTLGMNSAPASGDGVTVTGISFEGPCAAAWYPPSSFAIQDVFLSATTSFMALRVRPLAAGACDADVVVASDAANTPPGDGAHMHLHADVVDDGSAGGCRVDGACCCAGNGPPVDAACNADGHLDCGGVEGGGALFFDGECSSDPACAPPVQP